LQKNPSITTGVQMKYETERLQGGAIMGRRIGLVGTRFAGTDGVSLEASKWAQVLERDGHTCFWFAGELERDQRKSLLAPAAHFKNKQNQWINNQIFGRTGRNSHTTELIHLYRAFLKSQLYEFIDEFKIDLLIAENALTIPLHVPLGLALAETIAEKQLPTIAHHHDFYWERNRFARNGITDYLRAAFPPRLPGLLHVVINSEAQEQLALRSGIASVIIPNVLDFANPPRVHPESVRAFRNAIGLMPEDKMILQPTRVIRRKGIEHAIELVHQLADPRYKLVVTHEAGDEGFEYAEWLQEYARERLVDLRMAKVRLADPWTAGTRPHLEHSLWDIYPDAELVTYPSSMEGFGNALLEAIYFKKPVLINRYATFVKDIEPLGFDFIEMNGYLPRQAVQKVRAILGSEVLRTQMVEHNYDIAQRHYAYDRLRDSLRNILTDLTAGSARPVYTGRSQAPNIVYLPRDKSFAMAFEKNSSHSRPRQKAVF
jgi:glycosyltransferase involved in cell wall biosynthesis